MFVHTQGSINCLTHDHVCDNQIDCPYGDDESLCDIRGQRCPTECECVTRGASCASSNLTTETVDDLIGKFDSSKCCVLKCVLTLMCIHVF